MVKEPGANEGANEAGEEGEDFMDAEFVGGR